MNSQKGMTLIELIVAMAVIAIVSLAVLALFTTAFNLVLRAGDETDAAFQTHAQIEAVLRLTDTDPAPSNITFEFQDGSEYVAEGNIEVFSQSVNNSTVEISFFQPKY